MDEKPKKLQKPTSYDQLYPGRFLKAAELLGKKVTLTISDVDMEELEGDDGKRAKAIVSFAETEKKLVLCKTNGLCIREMFGKVLKDWYGKKVTLFEDTWNGEPATRIWGSPDIANDLEVQISLPRRRPFKKTLHRVVKGATGNGTPASKVPTTARAIEMLQRTADIKELVEQKRTIWALYGAADQAVPVEVEAAWREHGEQLEHE